ncbi:hypothetical protein JCM8115_005415 [Rhodotorula mucilaginosa]
MTVILHALSYLAVIAAFVFGLLSLANGLLYIAEVIEEHAQLAKTVGQRLVYVEILLLAALYAVDGLPLHLVAVGILAHVVYLQNFSRHWPVISIKSITFVASCLLVLLSHFLSFRYFSDRSASSANAYHGSGRHSYGHDSRRGRYAAGSGHQDSFLDVATYFAVCVWLVPFYLFLSLSANDNVLPSAGAETPSPSQPSSPSVAQKAAFLSPAPSTSRGGGGAPDSPSLGGGGRHQRQRSSMMKSALSSAFSIMPASLRPAHLSAQLPLPQGKGSTSTGGSPRQDLPRSPSPTYHFHPVPGSGPSSTPSTPGGGGGGGLVSASMAADASTSAFSVAVAANGAAAATSHAFARAKRPVPLRSVTASPTITTDNFPPSYPPAPHSAGVLVTSPVNTTFAPSLRPVNVNVNGGGGGGGGMPRSQPNSPAQNRFPLAAPLSASGGPSMTNPFGNNNNNNSGGGGGGTPSASSPSSRRGSAGPQQPSSPAAPRLTTSLSSQGGGGGVALPSSNHYTGLGVAGLARRNTVDAGVSGVGSGSVSVNMGGGAAPPVRRPSAMGDGIQQRRPVQDPSNR